MNTNQIENSKGISTISKNIKQYGFGAVLMAILIYFGQVYVGKIQALQKDLQEVKIEIVKIQKDLVPASTLRDQIKSSIEIHEKIYHKIGDKNDSF